jgi:stalled ribosome rescue protein Dom34
MTKTAGLWIDHRKAVVVTLADGGERKEEILSHVEKQLGRVDGKRSTASFESQRVKADDRQQRGFTKHLDVFYEKVLRSVHDVQSVLIFGPGEAKGELKKRLARGNHDHREVAMEPADKMTDHQITEKVRRHYAEKKVGQEQPSLTKGGSV